jgi:hypothetical protein
MGSKKNLEIHIFIADGWKRHKGHVLEKDHCCQQMMLEKLGAHMQKNEGRPLSFTRHRNELTCIKNLNIRHKTTISLGGN